jgi:hypothetical protein
VNFGWLPNVRSIFDETEERVYGLGRRIDVPEAEATVHQRRRFADDLSDWSAGDGPRKARGFQRERHDVERTAGRRPQMPNNGVRPTA